MAAQLWTHGFDCFAPLQAVVYHLWTRDHRPNFASRGAAGGGGGGEEGNTGVGAVRGQRQ